MSQLTNNTTELQQILNEINSLPDAIVVDSALSSTSINPVQNKVVNTAISNLQTELDNIEATIPVKGTHYWTAADQESIVQQVIAALGTPVWGRVDADNNIILSGDLTGGTYTVKYEDADGNVITIGTIAQAGVATNLADPASADWKPNYRLNSSGALVTTAVHGDGGAVTNFIPCKPGDVIRVKGLDIAHYYANTEGQTGRTTAYFYAEDKSTIIAKNVPADGNGWVLADDVWTYTVGTSLTAVSGDNSAIRYARLTGIYYDGYTADDVIITVNEEIV